MPQSFQTWRQVLAVKIMSVLEGDPRFEELYTDWAAAEPSAADSMLFGPVFGCMYLDPQCGHCEDMNILAFQRLA